MKGDIQFLTSRDTFKEKKKKRTSWMKAVCESFLMSQSPPLKNKMCLACWRILCSPLILANGGSMVCKAFLTSLTFSTHFLPVDDKRKHFDLTKIHSHLNISPLNAHPHFSLSFRWCEWQQPIIKKKSFMIWAFHLVGHLKRECKVLLNMHQRERKRVWVWN